MHCLTPEDPMASVNQPADLELVTLALLLVLVLLFRGLFFWRK